MEEAFRVCGIYEFRVSMMERRETIRTTRLKAQRFRLGHSLQQQQHMPGLHVPLTTTSPLLHLLLLLLLLLRLRRWGTGR